MSLDIEQFAREMERRPALYNPALKEYADKDLKKKLWVELCAKFIENWNGLRGSEKELKGKELQKKWKNLRSCFKREYNAQRRQNSEPRKKKRHKYLYFEQLSFLSDSVLDQKGSSNSEAKDSNEDEVSETDEMEDTSSDRLHGPSGVAEPKRKKAFKKSYEENLIHILKDIRDEERDIDEDKYFLMSLLPSFKKFNEEQKFIARTEIMKVMRQVRLSENFQTDGERNPIPSKDAPRTQMQIFPASEIDG